MKTNPPPIKFVAAILGLGLLGGWFSEARAQLNERRVERDATGVYNGRASGGRIFHNYWDPLLSDTHYSVPAGSGKARVPVKDGRLFSNIGDSDLPGNDRAVCRGVERRSDVRRGGKLVAIRYVGTVKLDEGAGHGPWTNGRLAGNLLDRGPKWYGNTKGTATQRNPTVPQPNTKMLSGLTFRGRG